jgi:hypothetical protein
MKMEIQNPCRHGVGKQMALLKQVLNPTDLNVNNTNQSLESVRSRVQQAYQKVENEKKRNAIQVIDFQPIPKQGKLPETKRLAKKPWYGVRLQKAKLDSYHLKFMSNLTMNLIM